jgi:tetratricopeptide (TPR) repeat protein
MELRYVRIGFALAVVYGFVLWGCQKKAVTNKPVTPAPSVSVAAGPALTESDYHDFGTKLEAAINVGDQETAIRLYRVAELAERCISDLDFSEEFRRGYLAGVKKAGAGQMAMQIIDAVKKGGMFKVLRVRSVGGRPHVLIRLVVPDQGVNYQELTLTRHADGEIGVEDIFVLLTGEMLSQTMRRMVINIAAESEPGLLGRLTAPEKLYAKHWSTIQTIITNVREGRLQPAFTLFRQLPIELQRDKVVELMGLSAARGVSDDEYLRLLEEFRLNHPGDATVDLVSIDYYLLKKQHDECLACIDRVEKAVGGDPYLAFIRGNTFFDRGSYTEAKQEFEKAIEQEPTLQDAYWSRITVALKEENHADTLDWLKRIVERCNVVMDEDAMRAAPEYTAFVNSREFSDFHHWLTSQAN